MPFDSHQSTRCPDCGAVLPRGQPQALCPRCALKGALELGDETKPIDNHGQIATDAPPIHTRIRYFGDYELLEEIARGGMGVVYRARQSSLNRDVALKMILAGELARPEDVQRFRTEAEAVAKLQHPNIVAIHEVGQHEGHHYFSMDLIEGPSLSQLLRDGPLPAKQAASYVKIIAEAIHYAHEQGILHRDLKPSNVLIDRADQPRVTDFGLAKDLSNDSSLSVTGQVVGSPSFMAPEQASGQSKKVGVTSDVYSIGTILYHALTGRPPFTGHSIADTLKQVENVEPITPCLLDPSIPRDLETICLKCLQKESGKRYQSARQLAEELGRWLNHVPILARPAGPILRLNRWVRRNPTSAALHVVLLFALGLAVSLAYVSSQLAPRQGISGSWINATSRSVWDNVKQDLRKDLIERTNAFIETELRTLWSSQRPSVQISSEQLADFVGLPKSRMSATMTRYRLGVLVDDSPLNVAYNLALVLPRVEESISRYLHRSVYLDITLYTHPLTAVDGLLDREVDFICLGALLFLRAQRLEPRIQPLLQSISGKKGAFFTREKSGIRSLREVEGKKVAFVGSTNSTLSFYAQVLLSESGVSSTNLEDYVFLENGREAKDHRWFPADSLSAYMDAIQLRQQRKQQILPRPTLADRLGQWREIETSDDKVILRILDGTYDVGVANAETLAWRYDLSQIPNSQFECPNEIWVARASLGADAVNGFLHAMADLEPAYLSILPTRPRGFVKFDEAAYERMQRSIQMLELLFPPKPSRIESLFLYKRHPIPTRTR